MSEFREYSPAELAVALLAAGESLDVVDVELQSPSGEVIATGVLQLSIGHGHDIDRTGGYRWLTIKARQEPRSTVVGALPESEQSN